MRVRLAVPAIVALLALLVAGCGGGEGASLPADVVAVVGADQITRGELDALLSQIERSYKAQKQTFPKAGSQEYAALLVRGVALLVQRSEFEQKAKELGITITPAQIEERVKQLKKQRFGGSEERYQKEIAKQGFTDKDVRDTFRVQLLSTAIFAKVTAGATVSDAEVANYYKAHSEQYSTPRTREVRHILVKTKALAEKLRAQLEAGTSFAALAKKNSQDGGTKQIGGALTVSKGQFVAPFERVAFALETGTISQPVKTQYGWHIIEALKPAKPATTTPLSKVKKAIREQLLQQKRSETLTAWIGGLTKAFCSGKLRFAAGYTPSPDPCAPSQGTTAG